jgi:hypothetical protein
MFLRLLCRFVTAASITFRSAHFYFVNKPIPILWASRWFPHRTGVFLVWMDWETVKRYFLFVASIVIATASCAEEIKRKQEIDPSPAGAGSEWQFLSFSANCEACANEMLRTILFQVVNAAVSLLISERSSSDLTDAMTVSVFAEGHFANSAQPLNLSATSS